MRKYSYPDCISFQGGGVKCIAHIGALTAFDENNRLANLTQFAGSSGGGLIALLFGIGMSFSEIYKTVYHLDLTEFQDAGSLVSRAWRFFKYGALYKGKKLTNWLRDLVAAALGDPDATFQEAYDQTGRTLFLTGTDVLDERTIYFSHLTHPDMPLYKAARISMSHPIFEPVEYRGRLYFDGGALDNLPLTQFQKHPVHVVGFKLLSDDEKIGPDGKIEFEDAPHRTFIGYWYQLLNVYLRNTENSHIHSAYWDNVIKIHTGSISATKFSLTKEERETLVAAGYKGATDWLETVSQGYYSDD